MDELERMRKKIKKELEETIDMDEESDHPIHEHYTKEKSIKKGKQSKQ